MGAEEHNLRAFPLAGIADAAEVPGVLLKYGEFTTPFDLRDGINVDRNCTEIKVAVVGACHGFTNASYKPSVRPSLAAISSNFR
jgi:hypothetical protein